MAYDIGTARGVIELDYNGRGVDQAEEDLDKVSKSGKSTEQALNKVANTSAVAGAAIVGGLAVAVNAAANFEQRMSAVAAVSGATGSEMDKLSAKALQLGKDTQFSATEGAQAIEELVKAGLSTKDVLNGAADATVNLAAAGEIDLPQAAMIASNAMNQFNLNAKDMVSVSDQIAGAANASAIDVSDFGQSLSQVGAVANLAGVSFQDTATAIAIMGNAGIKGSDAGTSLKSMFARLIPQTKAQVDVMSQLGLLFFDNAKAAQVLRQNGIKPLGTDTATLQKQMGELGANLSGADVGSAKAAKATEKLMLQTGAMSNAFYDAKGNLKGLGEISGVLQESMKGMTKQQKQSTLQTLFGSDAIRAAAILSNKGAKGFDNMSKSMKKVSAADVAAKRMDNFKGSLEQMKGSLETAEIAMGQVLLPTLRQLVDLVTSVANAFLGLNPNLQKFIVIAAAVVGIVLLVVAAVIKTAMVIKQLQEALVIIRGVMATTWIAALGPIALVIAAIAAIIVIIIILWKKSETFRKIVTGAWNAIKAAAKAVANWFVKTLPGLFSAAWNSIKNGTVKVWNSIISFFKGAGSKIVAAVKGIKDKVIGFFLGGDRWLYDAGRKIIEGLVNGIKSMGGAIANAVKGAAGKFAKFLPGSPVKEGPLKVLNNGYAGKQIIQMIIDGLDKMSLPLSLASDQVMSGIQPSAATPSLGVAGRPRGASGDGAARRLRIVEGRLAIDESGRAFIRGVAREEVQDDKRFDNVRKLMG